LKKSAPADAATKAVTSDYGALFHDENCRCSEQYEQEYKETKIKNKQNTAADNS